MVSPTPRPLYPQERDPVPIVQEAGWAPVLVTSLHNPSYYIIIIIIIIIIILVITFMQDINNYVPETNHVYRVHSIIFIIVPTDAHVITNYITNASVI